MEDIRMTIVGSGGVGKSAVTVQFYQNHFVEGYDPTIEDSYRRQIAVDDKVCMLDILDTAGQEEYSCMREQYLRHGEGFMFVFSLISRSTFDEMTQLKDMLLRVRDADDFKQIPVVVIGNKCDMPELRQVEAAEAKQWAEAMGASYLEVSAKERINIDEAFFEVVRKVRSLKTPEQQKQAEKRKKQLAKCNIL